MKRILILSILILFTLVGCGNNSSLDKPQDKQVALEESEPLISSEVRPDYYEEGIRLLNQYCSEEAINTNYEKIKNLTVDEAAAERMEEYNKYGENRIFEMLKNIAQEYVSRAENSSESLFSENVYSLMMEADVVVVYLHLRDNTAVDDKEDIANYTQAINDYYNRLSLLYEAKTLTDLNQIPGE